MSDEHLVVMHGDEFAVVTLSRPAKRNALTFAMRRALASELATLAAADDVAALRAAVGDGPARELALTARSFPADEGYRLGMLADLVDDGTALTRATAIARELASLPRRGLLLQTEIIRATAGKPLAEGVAYEAEVFRREVLKH